MLIAGAAPRGFRDRLEGAMDAELITGATEAIDEPTDRGEKTHEDLSRTGLNEDSDETSHTFCPINLLYYVISGYLKRKQANINYKIGFLDLKLYTLSFVCLLQIGYALNSVLFT